MYTYSSLIIVILRQCHIDMYILSLSALKLYCQRAAFQVQVFKNERNILLLYYILYLTSLFRNDNS